MQRTSRLPGIRFRAEPPASVALPRMDVAAFVGFAQCGPINLPVAVEDYPYFEDIFGGSFRIAWDDDHATWQTACLAPAVKDFFAQGGRRCWIVRVAAAAQTNRFPLAGLLCHTGMGYQGVMAEARSAGSWSDRLQASGGLLADALNLSAQLDDQEKQLTLSLAPQRGMPLMAGDMLQLDFDDNLLRAYVVLTGEPVVTSDVAQVTVPLDHTYWFRKVVLPEDEEWSCTISTIVPGSVTTVTGKLSVELGELPASQTLKLELNADLPFQDGDFLKLEIDTRTAWLMATRENPTTVRVIAAWFEGRAPGTGTLAIKRALRVRIALQAQESGQNRRMLTDLAFSEMHPRYMGYVPPDATMYDRRSGQAPNSTAQRAAQLWQDAQNPRFPLAVRLEGETVVIPLGLSVAPIWRSAVSINGDALTRDGLVPNVADSAFIASSTWSEFWKQLFLDPVLRQVSQGALIAVASDHYYIQERDLSGLHALFPVDEVSMVALPDAAHRPWMLAKRERFVPAAPPPKAAIDPCQKDSPFTASASIPLSDASSAAKSMPFFTSEEAVIWKLVSPLEYDDSALLEIQTKAAEFAAARADMVMLLGLPKHYRVSEALRFERALWASLHRTGESTPSYAAIYHPWLVARSASGDLLHTCPTGAVSGVVAARALSRGAWVAPANVAIEGVIAVLTAITAQEEETLSNVGVNLIRPNARGLVVWGAMTQSFDPDFEALNVRRLLILLRRFALMEGQNTVFEPHSAALQQRIRQDFEQYLSTLFTRGAFAGRTASEGYEVVMDETINTQASIEQGRLIVELRVAPSHPVTFITVQLMQQENGLLTVREVTGDGR